MSVPFIMVIEMTSPLVPIGFPEGITIRSMVPGEEKRVVVVWNEIFRDHWGYVEESFKAVYQRLKAIFLDNPEFDPRLFFLAMHGDEMVGISLCLQHAPSDASMGWISTLGVRRNWRKMGLGLGLLRHSFDALYQTGIRRVGLGVDTSNLTGAVRLYEKAGMKVARQFDQYELELRPGKEIMVTGLH
jgi:mycothiol synthase